MALQDDDTSTEPETDPEVLRSQRFAQLPDAIGPQDWVLTHDADGAPWTIYTAPDVVEENVRRWGFAG